MKEEKDLGDGEGIRLFNKICLVLYGISFLIASPFALDVTGFLRFSQGTAPAVAALVLHLLQGSLAIINIMLLRDSSKPKVLSKLSFSRNQGIFGFSAFLFLYFIQEQVFLSKMDELNYPAIMERATLRVDYSRVFALWFICLVFLPVFHTLSFSVLISQTSILNHIEVVSDEKPKKNDKVASLMGKKAQEEEGSDDEGEACSLTSSSDDEEYR